MIIIRVLLNTLLQHGKTIWCGLQLISVDKMNCLTLTLMDLAAILDTIYAMQYLRWYNDYMITGYTHTASQISITKIHLISGLSKVHRLPAQLLQHAAIVQ